MRWVEALSEMAVAVDSRCENWIGLNPNLLARPNQRLILGCALAEFPKPG